MNEAVVSESVSGPPQALTGDVGAAQATEPPWKDLTELFVGSQVIPFLGAAASAYCCQKGGGPPSVDELLQSLADKAQLKDLRCKTNGCAQSRFDLARVASYYQTTAPRHRLDAFLTAEINNPAFVPNPLHHLLARIARQKPMLIITTNYDNLLEKAFDKPDDEKGPVPYEVVVTPADQLAYASTEGDTDGEPDGKSVTEQEIGREHAGGVLHWVSDSGKSDFEPVLGADLSFDLNKRSIIYKIHGSVPRGSSWSGGYLIAEEDYTRFLGRMERRGLVPDPIKNIIGRKKKAGPVSVPVFSLLFLGYGLRDWNLRVLLEELHVGSRSRNVEVHYAFMKGPDPVDKRLLEKRQVTVFDCDLANFVDRVSPLIP